MKTCKLTTFFFTLHDEILLLVNWHTSITYVDVTERMLGIFDWDLMYTLPNPYIYMKTIWTNKYINKLIFFFIQTRNTYRNIWIQGSRRNSWIAQGSCYIMITYTVNPELLN